MENTFEKVLDMVSNTKPTHISRLRTATELSKLMLNHTIMALKEMEVKNANLLLQAHPELTKKQVRDRWKATAWSKTTTDKIEELHKELTALL